MSVSMATFHGTANWDRASHDGTTVTADGEVILGRADARDAAAPPLAEDVTDPWEVRPSMSIDDACHLYRSVPTEPAIDRYLIGELEGGRTGIIKRITSWAQPDDGEPAAGTFHRPAEAHRFLPAALTADRDGRVWIADADGGEIIVYDRWSRRILQRRLVGEHIGGPNRRVVDLASSGQAVYAVCTAPAGLVRMTLGSENEEMPRPALEDPQADPARVTALRDRLAVLFTVDPQPGAPRAGWVVSYADGDVQDGVIEVVDPSDIELLDVDRSGEGRWSLYVAGRPDGIITQFRFGNGAWRLERQMGARGYDGRGIIGLPDGSVGFWTDQGLQRPLVGRGRLATNGRVTTLALDAREFGGRWGRIFLDACVPPGTSIRLHSVTSDDQERIDESPASPPASLLPGPLLPGGRARIPVHLAPGRDEVTDVVHRRSAGRPEPWSRVDDGDRFGTYEAPVIAAPGRYLWLTFELGGTGSATPRIRTVKVERSTHGHVDRLPRVFSRDDREAFLDRYLAMMTGIVDDLDTMARRRHVLLDPRSVPEEALPWLASFVGLVLDDRWPLERRRKLVAEATAILSNRGTVWALTRMLELLLGVTPILIEHFRLRGVGGVLLTNSDEPTSTSVLGAGFRVGGGLDDADRNPLVADPDDDAVRADHAHRFSVLVPRFVSPDEQDAIDHLLDVHRPAHTVVDVCALGAGMRVGRGLHLEMSSLVGPTGQWSDAWIGQWHLGRNALIGDVGSPRLPAALGTEERLR